MVELPGFQLYRNDRLHKRGGGVAAFVRSELQTVVVHASDTSRPNKPEYIFLDVCINHAHVLVAVCYRPPNIGYMAEFEGVLLDLMARYRHVIVMGDFNADLLGPATYDQTNLTSMFQSCNMTILTLDATHHSSTADTWLDVMAVTDAAHVAHHGQLPAPGLSRHDLIFCVYRLNTPKSKPKFIQYRDYKKIIPENLLSDARCAPWGEVVRADNVDGMVESFTDIMNQLLDKHAPLVTKRVTREPAPWIDDVIKQLQRQRDSAFRKAKQTKTLEDWNAYKTLRNQTQQKIRNAKIRFFYNSFSKKSCTKDLWAKAKKLGIGKVSADKPIHLDVNVINDFLVDIPIDLTGARDYVKELESDPHVDRGSQFSFTPVTEADVKRAIARTTSNAVGADNIPISFIKDTLSVTLPVITHIFNKSLSTSVFPSIWKSAIVLPLQKNSSPQSPADYRPISILPALSKCLERIVHEQIMNYIETNVIVSIFQSGFRSRHSTASALLKVTEDIRAAMDNKLATLLTLFDFSKAFDCVYRPLLLIKLKSMGFSQGCVDWVASYLTDRRQCVKAGDRVSRWRSVTRGVPQGSVLGPLLFILYIDDITKILKYSMCHLYADDFQIYRHFCISDFEDCVAKTNYDIKTITSWAFKHGLKLNETKTQAMVVGHSRLLNGVDFNTVPKLQLNGKQLEYCDKVKNLGLIMNKNLNWTEHVNGTCNRVFAGIHSLKRFSHCFPFDTKVMLVKALVFPHFDYCDVVINDMTVELSDRLQRAQNYCIRYIFNLRRTDHVTPSFDQLSLLKLGERRKHHILNLLHSVINTNTPRYLSERFNFISEISERNTRHGSSLLVIPTHRTEMFSKSYTVTACRLWNSLPTVIKNIDKRARFGAELNEWLLRDARGR